MKPFHLTKDFWSIVHFVCCLMVTAWLVVMPRHIPSMTPRRFLSHKMYTNQLRTIIIKKKKFKNHQFKASTNDTHMLLSALHSFTVFLLEWWLVSTLSNWICLEKTYSQLTSYSTKNCNRGSRKCVRNPVFSVQHRISMTALTVKDHFSTLKKKNCSICFRSNQHTEIRWLNQ